MKNFFRALSLLAVFILLVSMACSISTQPTKIATQPPENPPEGNNLPPGNDLPVGAIASLEDARNAVVMIVAEGTFAYPEGWAVNAFGAGTGFIIDPDGIAITANHVVTGAALLKVYIQGENRPKNAKVLGASECSDLAVIDISGGDYPYLSWYEDDVKVGMDVYSAGYPLADPEYTLTRGVISKARAGGESSWASVDSVLEHDATINPGNSGGPLLNPDGQVVGINYALSLRGRNQYFAISYEEAFSIIEEMIAGKDVNSIGINGTAINDGNFIGIWVSSVKSGSPADKAGVRAGDIIVQLEGVVLSTDGTMADYCDILRTHNPGDTLSLTVYRWMDDVFLEGQINGRPLQ